MSIRIVGLGGTYRPRSSTEQALRVALASAAALGAETVLLGAEELDLPLYRPGPGAGGPAGETLHPRAVRLLDEIRSADGIIVASPGYHGTLSGLVKNALDYIEELRKDRRPYLEGRAVGCVATGAGWQATASTLATLRTVAHALRGWPTPLGVCINTMEAAFTPAGPCSVPGINAQLELVGQQVTQFALRQQVDVQPRARRQRLTSENSAVTLSISSASAELSLSTNN